MTEEIKKVTRKEALAKLETIGKNLSKVAAGFRALTMLLDFDKYFIEKPTEIKPVKAQEVHIKAVAAKLSAGGISDRRFETLKQWAREAYGWRYIHESSGDRHPLSADLRVHLDDFTDKQLTEIENILEG